MRLLDLRDLNLLFEYKYKKIFVDALNRFNDLEYKKGNISFEQYIKQKIDNNRVLTKVVDNALANKQW